MGFPRIIRNFSRNLCHLPVSAKQKLLVLLVAASTSMVSYAGLESPQGDSTVSGIGLIRGWVCDATEVTVRIDGGEEKAVAYGNPRGDTESVCGDKDNGFETLWNWNMLGDGEHTVVAYADGTVIGNTTFNVVTLGMSTTYVTGLSATYVLDGFPVAGSTTEVTWSETDQNFVISAVSSDVTDGDFEPTDWTDETHSKSADPDFDEVFDDTQVKRLDIVVTEERWQSMLDDMTETYGEFGQRTGGPGLIDTDEDPIFVPAEVFYNGIQWYRVGIRFKGNSSLQSSWQSGVLKLPFKLDFDEFEDDYPQIDNQRFYGFKKFSLKNNFDDESLMREKVAADVFKNAGVPVSHTAFYTLYVDHGNGPEYFGLYTLVEEVDGTVLDTQFSSDDGNLYKPEDGSANFVEGTFDSADFEKKTNEDEEDWSDIIALFEALHDDTATTDPATWRANLEAVFDVDGFLKYLAVNGIIQNWDSYGRMAHNYYLYNNPETEQVTWIPWDNNEALQEGKLGGSLALDFSDLINSEWPLIARIYADDVYKAQYDMYLSEVISSVFDPSSIQATYDNYSTLIAPYATSELSGYSFLENDADFYSAVDTLKSHAASRATAVSSYLYNQ